MAMYYDCDYCKRSYREDSYHDCLEGKNPKIVKEILLKKINSEIKELNKQIKELKHKKVNIDKEVKWELRFEDETYRTKGHF